jgi:hypothetical protein
MPKEKLSAAEKFLTLYRELLPKGTTFAKNDERYEALTRAMKSLETLIVSHDPKAEIEIKQVELNPCAVSFEAIVQDIIVEDVATFISSISEAENFEIYYRTDKKIAFAVIFNNAYKEVFPKK